MNKKNNIIITFVFLFSLTLFSQEEKKSEENIPKKSEEDKNDEIKTSIYDLIITGKFKDAEKASPDGDIKDALKELLELNQRVAKSYESEIGKELSLTVRGLPMTGTLEKIKGSTIYLRKKIKRGTGTVLMPVRIGQTPIDDRLNRAELSDLAKNICLGAKFYHQKNYPVSEFFLKKTGDYAGKFQDSLVRKSNYFMPLFMACVDEDTDKIDEIIKKGGDVNSKCSAMVLNPRTKKHTLQTSNLLIEIIKKRKTESVKHLVKSGSNINAQNSDGVTPVMFTLTYYPNDTEVMEFLIENKADLKHMDIKGNTTLSGAIALGRKDAVKLLLEKGADPDQAISKGLTPVMIAALANQVDIFKMLLNAGADINKKSPKTLNYPKGFSIFELDQSQMLPEIRKILAKLKPEKKKDRITLPGGVEILR